MAENTENIVKVDLQTIVFKLKGIAALFGNEDDTEKLFSGEQLEGIYYIIGGIAKEVESLL